MSRADTAAAVATSLDGFAGIEGTLHTNLGDRELGAPTSLRVHGRIMTLSWALIAVPWPSGVIEGFTLSIEGAEPWRRPMADVAYGQGDNMTLEQRVEMT